MNVAVLVVDDSSEIREGILHTLRRSPYAVRTAASGEEALDVLQRYVIDIVVSDERMPGMAGTELLGRVAREHPDIVRILLTGHAEFDAAVRAINQANVFRFLRKPCPPSEIRAAIDDAAAQRRRERSTAQLMAAMRAHVAAHEPSEAEADDALRLTPEMRQRLSPRERDVLRELAAGYRIAEVAERLFISPHTVRNHVKALFRKLKLNSQSALIRFARGDLGPA